MDKLREAIKRVNDLLEKTKIQREAFQWEYLDEDIKALQEVLNVATALLEGKYVKMLEPEKCPYKTSSFHSPDSNLGHQITNGKCVLCGKQVENVEGLSEIIDEILRGYLAKWIKEDGQDMGIGTLRREDFISAIITRLKGEKK